MLVGWEGVVGTLVDLDELVGESGVGRDEGHIGVAIIGDVADIEAREVGVDDGDCLEHLLPLVDPVVADALQHSQVGGPDEGLVGEPSVLLVVDHVVDLVTVNVGYLDPVAISNVPEPGPEGVVVRD